MWAVAVSPDGAKLAVAGQFTTLNGSSNPGYGLGHGRRHHRRQPAHGRQLRRPQRRRRRSGRVAGLGRHRTSTAPGYTFGAGGTIEGTFAAAWDDGTLRWANDCHGDTYSVHPRGALYAAGTPTTAATSAASRRPTPTGRSTAGSPSARRPPASRTGTPTATPTSRASRPRRLLAWYPSINAGTFTGMNQGPWSVVGQPGLRRDGRRVHPRQQQGAAGPRPVPGGQRSPNARGRRCSARRTRSTSPRPRPAPCGSTGRPTRTSTTTR